jgi:hypothetical protein
MKRPDLTIEYKLGDETKAIRWSYGLSTDIQRLVPGIDDAISHFQFRPEIRDYVLRRCLTEKKGFVKEEKDLIDADVIDEIEPDAVLAILDWVQGHLCFFFGSSAESTHRRAQELKEVLGRLNPSTTGSPVSPSGTLAAGPSE